MTLISPDSTSPEHGHRLTLPTPLDAMRSSRCAAAHPTRGRSRLIAYASLLLSISFASVAHAQLSFTSIPITDAQVGAPYSYTMEAELDDDDDDDDDDELEFDALALPDWLEFDGVDTISGTPTAADVGLEGNEVSLTVESDDEGAFQDFTIDVAAAPNTPPQLDAPIPPQSTTEGVPFSFDASEYFSDADGDALTYSLQGGPGWLTINAGTGRLSGTPPPGASISSPYTFSVIASDGTAQAQGAFTLNVAPANRAPSASRIAPDPQQAIVGEDYAFATASFFNDPDGDALTFSAQRLPATFTIDSSSGVVSGRPVAGDAAGSPYVITVIASDGELQAQSSYTLQVIVINRAPVLDSAIAPDPQQTRVGEPYTFDAGEFFSDPDGDALSFTAQGLPAGLTIGAQTGVVSGTPPAGAEGRFTIRVSASDGSNPPAADEYVLDVLAVNQAPTLPEPPPTLSTPEDTPLEITPTLLNAQDDDPSSLSVVLSPPPANADYTVTDGATVVPAQDFNGTLSVEAQVDDGEATSNVVTVSVTVTPVNDAPAVEPIGSRTATEAVSFTLATAGFATDVDGDSLTFAAENLPAGMTIDAATGRISGAPARGAEGDYAVRLVVSDGTLSASVTFQLTVLPADDPPTLPDPPPALSTPEDTPLEITPQLLNADDEAPDSLEVLLSPPSPDADFTLTGGGTTVVPAENFNGTLTVEARVRDANATSNAVNVTITVTPVNDPPTVQSVPRQTATEASPFELDLAQYVEDAENDPLTYRATGLPPGVGIDVGTGRISGTPPAGTESGDYEVLVTVNDGSVSTGAEFVIAVVGAGRSDLAASIEVVPNPVLIDETATFTLTAANVAGAEIANLTLDASFSSDSPFEIDAVADTACTLEAGTNTFALFCAWGPLAAGESASVEVTGRAFQSGEILASAAVAISDAVPLDDTPANDQALATLIIAETLGSGAAQELAAPGARGAAAADYDGDGLEDLAVATAAGEPVLVFLNGESSSGGGKVGLSMVPLSAGEPSDANDVAAADFDGDGDVDLAVADATGAHRLLVNEGFASFSEAQLPPSVPASRAVSVDVNGDALPDLVFAASGGNPVYVNQGGLQFSLAAQLGSGTSSDVAAADIDGDSLPELVFANADGDAVLYRPQNGSYAPTPLQTGPATSVAMGDFDGNGIRDLVFGRSAAGTASSDVVLLSTLSGGLSFFVADELGAAPTVDVLTSDFDFDGLDDVVSINAIGSHQLFTNSGAANTTFLLHAQQFTSSAAAYAALGNLNSDDRLDIVVAGGDSVAVFLNDGRGNFGRGDEAAPTLTLLGEPAVTLMVGDAYQDAGATASDDVDGDLTSQIVVSNPVDTEVIGSYDVTYDVTDSSGNPAATLSRTVEVRAREASGGGGGGSIGAAALLALLTVLVAGSQPTRRRLRIRNRST